MTTADYVLLVLIAFVGYIVPTVVCFLKGKPWLALLGLVPGFLGLFTIAGAILWAKPNSRWARRFYGPQKMGRAEDWFRSKAEIEARKQAGIGAAVSAEQ
jgi:hypothetical protein